MNFFDQNGNPIAYCDDSVNIFEYSGQPFGYFYNSSQIYHFNGTFIGWFESGYVYDNTGYPILFTENAHNGPTTPIKRTIPCKNTTRVLPIKSVVTSSPTKPLTRINWKSSSNTPTRHSQESPSNQQQGKDGDSVCYSWFYI